jgi:hypothetical protein
MYRSRLKKAGELLLGAAGAGAFAWLADTIIPSIRWPWLAFIIELAGGIALLFCPFALFFAVQVLLAGAIYAPGLARHCPYCKTEVCPKTTEFDRGTGTCPTRGRVFTL